MFLRQIAVSLRLYTSKLEANTKVYNWGLNPSRLSRLYGGHIQQHCLWHHSVVEVQVIHQPLRVIKSGSLLDFIMECRLWHHNICMCGGCSWRLSLWSDTISSPSIYTSVNLVGMLPFGQLILLQGTACHNSHTGSRWFVMVQFIASPTISKQELVPIHICALQTWCYCIHHVLSVYSGTLKSRQHWDPVKMAGLLTEVSSSQVELSILCHYKSCVI